jgi:hypothetical protein
MRPLVQSVRSSVRVGPYTLDLSRHYLGSGRFLDAQVEFHLE